MYCVTFNYGDEMKRDQLMKPLRLLLICMLWGAQDGVSWGQVLELRLINEYPSTSITASADLQFASFVDRLSQGQIQLKPLQEAANPYKGQEQLNAVRSGKTEIATLFAGILGGADPLFLLSSLPFVTADYDQAKQLFSCARPELETHLSSLNAHLLYVTPWPPSGIWSAKPVTDLASVRALRIRTYDDNSRGVFERLGGQSFNLPFSAVVPRLASGDLNAVLSSGDGGAGNRLWDYLPHFAAISYAIPLSFTVIQGDIWKQLSESQRAVLTEAAELVSARGWDLVKERSELNQARMLENGMRLNLSPSTEVREALHKAGTEQTESWRIQNQQSLTVSNCLH